MPPVSPSASSSSSSRQRRVLGATALGAVALLAGIGLVASPGGPADGPSEAANAPGSAHAASASALTASAPSATAAPEELAPPPRFQSTTCWPELEQFNAHVTLENFRDWAAPLLASREPLVRDYLKERLTELIGDDPARATQVLDWARAAAPRDVKVYLAALRDSEAIHRPQVAQRLVDMSLDPTLEPTYRATFLSALDTQKRLEPTALTRLAAYAREPASGEGGWAATRAIARVMKRDVAQGGAVSPYLDQLLTIGAESPDEEIRYLALSMPMHTEPRLDAQATERYARILATEGSEGGREAAIHNLSLSEDKPHVLDLFSRSFPTEPDTCVRWALFRFTARAGGKDALPLMAQMALTDPRFQPDYQAFERIYASGVADFERVWRALPDRDPHGCLDRHD